MVKEFSFLFWKQISEEELKKIFKDNCIFDEKVFEWLNQKNIIGYLVNTEYINYSANAIEIIKNNLYKHTTINYRRFLDYNHRFYLIDTFGKSYLIITYYTYAVNEIPPRFKKWIEKNNLHSKTFSNEFENTTIIYA